MDKIYVVYWSQTGNTEAMAQAVGNGIVSAGSEAEVLTVDKITAQELKDVKKIALGCPAMGAEVLEEDEMEPFVSELESFASGKEIALFGSYGWGDGEWMNNWVERMSNAGASVVNGEGVICAGMPDDAATSECEELGKKLAGA